MAHEQFAFFAKKSANVPLRARLKGGTANYLWDRVAYRRRRTDPTHAIVVSDTVDHWLGWWPL